MARRPVARPARASRVAPLGPRAALLLSLGLAALGGCDDGGAAVDGREDVGLGDATGGDLGPGDGGFEDAAPDMGPPPPACEGPVAHRYDPLGATELLQWPDGVWSTADAAHPGGHRLQLDADNAPWTTTVTPLVRSAVEDLNAVGGFARNGAAFFRFTDAVAVTATGEAPYAGAAFVWFDLDADPPAPVPFGLTTVEDDATVILSPLVPLKPGRRHLVGVTTALTDGAGGCVAPAPVMAALLAGEAPDPRLEPVAAELETARAALGWAPGALLAATVYRTQIDHLPLVTAAARARDRAAAWTTPPTCQDRPRWRVCEGTFTAADFRDADDLFSGEPQAEWVLPVSLWLPLEGTAPYPTLVYGHGIGSDRGGAAEVVSVAVPAGYAVVAIDALRHGDHPTATGGNSQAAMQFLGIDAANLRIDGLALRANFNQTVLDRLQLVHLLRGAPDVDGDGVADLDGERIGYWGISLGSLLAPGLLALEPTVGAAVLSVGGGNLMTFVTDTAQIAALRPVLQNLAGGADNLARLLPVLQAVVDAADPASWATMVNADRVDGAGAGAEAGSVGPHVLLPVAAEDGTVPPASGRALARAFGLPHLLPAVTEVSLLTEVAGPITAPAEGAPVRAYFQFDRISRGEDPNRSVVAATHNNTATGAEGALQALTFLDGWLDAAPVIVDPYTVNQTPPLR